MDGSSRASTATGRATRQPGNRNKWVTLVVILSATFMQLLDVSIVGVAIDSIQQTLQASYAQVQLVLVGYQIGFAATLILAARLGDIFGRRRLFLVGMAAFTLTSIACGLAPTIEALLVARVAQGLSSALMFSQVLAIIQVLFDPKERGAALGAYGTTIGLGTVLGPVAGGLLIQADLLDDAWRPIFLVNVPIGVVAYVVALVLLPEARAPRRPGLDVVGALLSAVGLGAVLYALAEGRSRSWPPWLVLTLAAGVVLLIGFVAHERRLSRADRDPVLDTRLFRDRDFRVGAALNLVFYAGVPGFFLVFSLFLQAGQGYGALDTGLAILAYAVGAAITATAADGIAAKIGNRILYLAAGLLVVGMLVLIATTHLTGTESQFWAWIPAMAISGLGFGLFVPPVIDIVLVNIDPARAGTASGSLTTFQQVGGAVGVAVLGVIFFGLIGQNAPVAAAAAAVELRAAGAASPDADRADQFTERFTRCFTEQARSADPTAAAGCALTADLSAGAADAYGRAVTAATADTFTRGFGQALWYQVGIYLLTFALITRLPEVNPRQLAQLDPRAVSRARKPDVRDQVT